MKDENISVTLIAKVRCAEFRVGRSKANLPIILKGDGIANW